MKGNIVRIKKVDTKVDTHSLEYFKWHLQSWSKEEVVERAFEIANENIRLNEVLKQLLEQETNWQELNELRELNKFLLDQIEIYKYADMRFRGYEFYNTIANATYLTNKLMFNGKKVGDK